MNTTTKILSAFVFVALLIAGCKSTNNKNDEPLIGQVYEDIPANVDRRIEGFPRDVQDHPLSAEGSESGQITYYSLGNDRTVDDPESDDWDIAFNNVQTDVTIWANSAHGGGILILNNPYDEVDEAPADGYDDEISSLDTPYIPANMKTPKLFVYSGSPAHIVMPNQDLTLIVKTPQGFYGKVKFLHYYKGEPDVEDPDFRANYQNRDHSYYSFDYMLQVDGTRNFAHEDKTTYFDLVSGEIVEDESSSQWNVGFNSTNIYGNMQNGGGVQLLNIDFDGVDEAPIEGYKGELQKMWYEYTMFGESGGPTHTVIPKSGKTIVVKTPDGKFAKFRVISYYKGNPDIASDEFINDLAARIDRYYTIEYVVQDDGSRFFK